MLFEKVCIIGIGHIGSSLARVIKRDGLTGTLVALDFNAEHRALAVELGIADAATDDYAEAISGADLVVLSTPVIRANMPKTTTTVAPSAAAPKATGSLGKN